MNSKRLSISVNSGDDQVYVNMYYVSVREMVRSQQWPKSIVHIECERWMLYRKVILGRSLF